MANGPSVTISAQVDESRLAKSIERAFATGVNAGTRSLSVNTKPMRDGIRGMTTDVRSFDQALDRANRRIISFGTAGTLIYGVVRGFKELVNAGIQVEKSLTSINSIFGLNARALDSFSKDLFNVARQTGQAFSQVAEVAEEFARQGTDAAETAKRTRDALILMRLSNIDAAKAVNGLTAAMATFGKTGIDTTDILNKLVRVDQSFAVSAGGIIDAFTKVGSTLDDAGVSLDRFIGLVTAARQITGRTEAQIGNSLKTIFTRLERSSTVEQLEGLGIAVRDTGGAIKSTIGIFDALANSYDRLSRAQQQQVTELGAGVFQINQFKALLVDLGKANGIAAQASGKAAQETNDALIRNAALNQTLAASLQNLKTNATEFSSVASDLALKPLFSNLVNVGNLVTSALSKANLDGDNGPGAQFGAVLGQSILKGIGNVLSGPGLVILGRLLVGVASRTFPEVIGDLKSTSGYNTSFGVGKVSGQNDTLLRAQNQLLTQATEQERKRYVAAASVAEQEAIILSLLERQLGVQAAGLGGATAAPRRFRGASRFPGAAGGYLPDAMNRESAAIAAGVGGAPSSARPVYMRNFARGSEQGIVANTSEYVVPTPHGPAIYNRAMIRSNGLPPGSTPVAAGGYMPNAAYGRDPTNPNILAEGVFDSSLRGQGGKFISNDAIDKLNNLFVTIRKAGTGDEARKLSKAVIDITQTLSGPSAQRVLNAYGSIITNLDKGYRYGPVIEPTPVQVDESAAPYISSSSSSIPPKRNWRKEFMEAERARTAQEAALIVRTRRESDAMARRQRLGGALQFGLIGLSLASGGIPEGTSGRATGQASGALTRGIQGAGIAGQVGSLFGPVGGAIGAGIGGLVGGIYGFITRSQKSFEELATDLEEGNRKIASQLEGATKVFQLDDQERDLRANGGSERDLARVRRQRTSLISSIQDTELRNLVLNRAANPNALADINRRGDTLSTSNRESGNLILASRGAIGFSGSSLRQTEVAAEAVTPQLAGLSDIQLKAFRSLSSRDPDAALAYLARSGKLTPGQREEMVGSRSATNNVAGIYQGLTGGKSGSISSLFGFSPTLGLIGAGASYLKGSTNANTSAFLSKAADNLDLSNARSPQAQTGQATISSSQLARLAAFYNRAGAISGIEPEADLQIAQAQQRVALSNPALTDLQRIGKGGEQNVANLRAQFGIRQKVGLFQGLAGIVGTLGGKDGAGVDQAVVEAIAGKRVNGRVVGGVSTLEELRALDEKGLPSNVSKEPLGDSTSRAIKDLVIAMEVLTVQEEASIRVAQKQVEIDEAAFRKTQSRAGANEEDSGAIGNSIDLLVGALARGDDSTTIQQRSVAYRGAVRRQQRRGGVISEGEADIGDLSDSLSLDQRTRQRQSNAIIGLAGTGSRLVGGAQLESALLGNAQIAGQGGAFGGSFKGGFGARFAGLKQDIKDLSTVGNQVAASLENGLGNAFGDFITGAQNAKDAFRSFATSVLGDAARAFGSKAVQSLLGLLLSSAVGSIAGGAGAAVGSAIPSAGIGSAAAAAFGGKAMGGRIGFASGGSVPVALTSGEVMISPSALRAIGLPRANAINAGTARLANGGMAIRGGSGIGDDLFGNATAGSYVFRKSAVQRYGEGNLVSMANAAGASVSIGEGSLTSPAGFSSIPGFADGGSVSTMASAPTSTAAPIMRGGGTFNIGVTINDNSTQTSSQSSTQGGQADRALGEIMVRRMKAVALQTIEEQQRQSGLLFQPRR